MFTLLTIQVGLAGILSTKYNIELKLMGMLLVLDKLLFLKL